MVEYHQYYILYIINSNITNVYKLVIVLLNYFVVLCYFVKCGVFFPGRDAPVWIVESRDCAMAYVTLASPSINKWRASDCSRLPPVAPVQQVTPSSLAFNKNSLIRILARGRATDELIPTPAQKFALTSFAENLCWWNIPYLVSFSQPLLIEAS